ncbi:MAG: ATP-binding protein [Candidatus Cloacimonetes bacterium]|nr:ATP-binding protein [Candidatus Cloacimonadota bacterium]MCF7813887.1 ATP-binding protein [Candidatus Cloacimonadota bacterium]MCF7868902.1 ATP-binding protein [Candidatus Cloacimonadota bacterium]MCF7883999.1 ATP-binding protein [Candidatus Cloacimonadota bacterium]
MKIAIASGKGGTGKTTLSTNLALFLSEKQAVILTDLDVEEPNSGLFINGKLIHQEDKFKMIPSWKKENCTLCGNCQKVCNFNAIIKLGKRIMTFPELCHSCFACSELCPTKSLPMIPQKMGELKHFSLENLDFIESKLDIGQEQAVPLIAKTLDYIDQKFGNNIIKLFDAPPGTSCPVIEATKDADFIILVTEPTPFGLHDLKLAVDTMKALKKNFAVVINRFGIGNNGVIDYCKSEEVKILAKLPNYRHIAELYSRGESIYQHIPIFKTELQKIADHIIKLQTGVAK